MDDSQIDQDHDIDKGDKFLLTDRVHKMDYKDTHNINKRGYNNQAQKNVNSHFKLNLIYYYLKE